MDKLEAGPLKDWLRGSDGPHFIYKVVITLKGGHSMYQKKKGGHSRGPHVMLYPMAGTWDPLIPHFLFALYFFCSSFPYPIYNIYYYYLHFFKFIIIIFISLKN